MTIQEALLNHLASKTSITDIVSTRIFTNHLPEQPQLPIVTVRTASLERHHNLDGPNGLVAARMQIEAWSLDYRQSLEIAEQVRLEVQNYRGTLSSLTIYSTTLVDDVETPEPPEDKSEDWIYSKALIFEVFFLEPLPNN